ncbi:hypothetical protein [Streptomyces sp. CB01881]|uniref:hypothetical protein n=1 Tax=Streptomyces sp. CB01881 TaxID=2078691 RepID=UPI000CDC0499|nr:hypothetical protein [Streptomyces sp. CB01881]AUY47676.1 hypothetical protein C2142_00360 [Streptomyces sp. CB01881]TYC76151.1 hypothetical protein EH183_00360 [Streptomyces sp. CB01881]
MLLKLTGSSGAGKTTLAFAVADRLDGVVVHDFDEVGVPDPPIPPDWRHRTTEVWVRRALEYQARGMDLLLSGNSPLGEVLAAPSAPLLDGIAVCLIDVADQDRRDRLAVRDGGRWDQAATDAFCGWAAWHRGHARDPRFRPDVIIDGSRPEMAWHRWTTWTAGDPRWRTHLIDTSGRSPAASVDQVERWVTEQREAHRSGRLALARGWTDKASRPTDHGA